MLTPLCLALAILVAPAAAHAQFDEEDDGTGASETPEVASEAEVPAPGPAVAAEPTLEEAERLVALRLLARSGLEGIARAEGEDWRGLCREVEKTFHQLADAIQLAYVRRDSASTRRAS